MLMVAIFGAIGSWLLGVFDTRFGTKKSMIMAMILMILSGVCGALATATGTGALVVIALIFVAMFMGASSNFTVSVAAQYWRREDFSGVFACVNPVSNIFNAVAPTIVAILIASVMGVRAVFIFLLVAGIIGLILMLAYNGAHVKTVDDTYRKAAGKPLDDALVGSILCNREIQSNTINHYRKGQHLRVLFFSAWEPVVINKKFIEKSLCHGEIAV